MPTTIYTNTPRPPPICIFLSSRLLSPFSSPNTAASALPKKPNPKPSPPSPTTTAPWPREEGEHMEGVNGGVVEHERKPLSEVVGDCVQRWFQDTLKEARLGDTAMQVLVSQMYHSGYGIPKNDHKANIWLEKAAKFRSSARKVFMKRPGYNVSDSDSDEANDDASQ